jgi:hypothetical protein
VLNVGAGNSAQDRFGVGGVLPEGCCELLPRLIELLGGQLPVDWPCQDRVKISQAVSQCSIGQVEFLASAT